MVDIETVAFLRPQRWLLVATACVIPSIATAGQGPVASPSRVYVGAAAGIEFNAGTPACVLSAVPESVRNVPIHPDDTYVDPANAGPIANAQLRCAKATLSPKGRVTLGVESHGWIVAADLTAAYAMLDDGDLAERNYTDDVGGTERGIGAALTYYRPTTVGPHWLSFNPGWAFHFARVVHRDPKGRRTVQLFADYSVEWKHLLVENGWDRYDQLQPNVTQSLGGLLDRSVSAGMTIPWRAKSAEVRVYVKRAVPALTLSALGTQSVVSTPRRWDVGIDLLFGRLF